MTETRNSTADVGATVTRIWGEVLAVPVGEESDFFESGGHSVTAMQVLNRIHDTYGVEVSVRDLFENPVLGEFIDAVRARLNGKADSCA
ncbi:phosphopantetheine-binding protein [Amycolatopsis tolypomycina]|uniref:Phosphopantetheine attachment site n=1 Tax=Amycolatopsis tolypomycina TaxID=208445 RepID=A0A1H4VWN8_9PSEU|nr:phosphopantetheine-binding protein [Amycolatopsis tolypomycina]SEC85280.1 Phosphopantetheine attachment site [Amycolatopsis tolypomycina]